MNDLTNPIGSVPQTIPIETTLPNSTSTDVTQVTGVAGGVRHQGIFGVSNPYSQQLAVANKNADKDALYERAIEWEADKANLDEQRAYARAVLEEQRAYDDPSAVIARQRAAGINSDLVGGSSGSTGSTSSSAQMNQPQMADQTAQSKFSNTYDNISQVFNGISTASNFVSGMVSSVSGIIQGISTLKSLPSQLALNDADASLKNAQANELNTLLSGKKVGQDLANVKLGVDTSSAVLQQLASFSELISPDTTDFTPILSSLGVPEDKIGGYSDIIRTMHSNPELRKKYAAANVVARVAEAKDELYTDEIVGYMQEIAFNTEYQQLELDYHRTNLESTIAFLLDNQRVADRTANNVFESLQNEGNQLSLDANQIELYRKQLANDTQAFLEALKSRSVVLEKNENEIANIRAKAESLKRPLTANEDAVISRLTAENIAVRSMLSSQFYQLKTSYLSSAHAMYTSRTSLGPSGKIQPIAEGSRELIQMFSDATFNDLIHHVRTSEQIANDWANTIVQGISTAIVGYGVAKSGGKRAPSTPKTTL